MAGTAFRVSKGDLGVVEERVYAKYDVSRPDARLAVEYLGCFFDAKKRSPHQLIILPQIADWAWHEFILDTERYRTVCSQVLGDLHHITTPNIVPDGLSDDNDVGVRDLELQPAQTLGKPRLVPNNLREFFQQSSAVMQDVYGLGLGSDPKQWQEAGWDSPKYRLRDPILLTRRVDEVRSSTCGSERSEQAPFLTWVPSRLVRRFGISPAAAQRGVEEYSDFFLSLRSPCNKKARGECSILCEIAWEEHILWTQRYADDCHKLLGYFLDHTPRKVSPNAETLVAFEAA